MRAVNRWLVAAVLVVVAIAVVGTLVRPTARAAHQPHGALAPVSAATLVCPSVTGGPGGETTTMTVATVSPKDPVKTTYTRVSPATGAGVVRALSPHPAATLTQSTPSGAVAVTATGPGAGSVAGSQVSLRPRGIHRGLADSACAAPATDWWFAGADGHIGITDLIVVTNPADAAANIAVSVWSEKGPITPPRVDNINVAAHSEFHLRASDLAPDVGDLAFHVHANSGTVTAAMLDLRTSGLRSDGFDWVPPTAPPSRSAVVTGYVAGAGLNVLYLVNPGDHDATVSLRVITTSRNFQPAGRQTVVVPAGRTTTVDLTPSTAGEVAAAQVSSDEPVFTQGITILRQAHAFPDYAWMAAQAPLTAPAAVAANAAPFGQHVGLVLTAPAGAAKVQVSNGSAQATVSVAAGRTTAVDLSALLHAGAGGPGPVMLTPLAPDPVYVVRTLYASGAHGPLLAAEMPTVLPAATVLPPVIADLRAATG